MKETTQQVTPGNGGVLDGFVTRKQLAAQLGRSTRTLERWHSSRIGPPRLVIGRLVLYRIAAVREWLAAQQERGSRRGRPPVAARHAGRGH